MKIQESAENYLETILILSKKKAHVRSIDIATELNFSKPSVSIAMKNLRENGYIIMKPDGYITLTEAGLAAAQTLYEKHTFFADWLKKLGVDPETAEEDSVLSVSVYSGSVYSVSVYSGSVYSVSV